MRPAGRRPDVTHDDGRVEVFHPATVASGERAYWGAPHGLLIDDFYRHARAGKHFLTTHPPPWRHCA